MMEPQSYARRLLRFGPMPAPRLDVAGFWRRRREAVLAQLGSVLGVLLLLCAGLWAVVEYVSFKAELQHAETARYLAEFDEPPVGDAWRRLSAAWQAEQSRQSALLERVAHTSGAEYGAALRDYRDFVLETIEERHLGSDIEIVRGFFARLGLCLRIGGCDPAVARAELGAAARQFRDQHYFYLQQGDQAAELERVVSTIAPRPRPGGAATSVAVN
jgi:hypothetical protein